MSISTKIRNLRRRLGWSRSDLARRMDCDSTMIEQWEVEASFPDLRQSKLLHILENHAESCSLGIKKHPLADRMLKTFGLEQVHLSELAE